MILADGFAATPAGYTLIITVPVMAAALGWMINRLLGKVDRVEVAMTTQTQALAVLVAELQPVRDMAKASDNRINKLELATAVLEKTLEKHENWAERTRDEMLRGTT